MNVQKVNYQKELEKLLNKITEEGRTPSLLLHSCCAPCSSYVMEYLIRIFFDYESFITIPISIPESEYTKRILEQQKLIGDMHFTHPVSFLAGKYDRDEILPDGRREWNI